MSYNEIKLTTFKNNNLTDKLYIFLGPFDDAVSSTISLTNPSELKVCYKIKTTAPKIYCVKPKSGVIDPNEEVNITGN